VRKPPRSCRGMNVDATRVQQPRKGKCLEAGIFKEAMLAKRVIKHPQCDTAKPNGKPAIKQSKKLDINPEDPYEFIRIDQNAKNDDIACDVCLDESDAENDEILICDLCQVAVHQSCYGGNILNKLPGEDQKWYCDRCDYLLKHKEKTCVEIKCAFCPDIDGAMKHIDSPQGKIWAHIVCVNWHPDIWFVDDKRQKIGGKVAQSKFDLTCSKCRTKEGACIQCDFKNCARSYHIRCAIRQDMIKSWEEMESRVCGDNIPVFCNMHEKEGHKILQAKGQEGIISKSPRKGARKLKIVQKKQKVILQKTRSQSKQQKTKAITKVSKKRQVRFAACSRSRSHRSKKEGIYKKQQLSDTSSKCITVSSNSNKRSSPSKSSPLLGQYQSLLQDPVMKAKFTEFILRETKA
jgi:hypothetical protein